MLHFGYFRFLATIVTVSLLLCDTCSAETKPECPPNYLPVASLGEHWCFLPWFEDPPVARYNFSYALETCGFIDDLLPILTTYDINTDLRVIGQTIWIGIVCNNDTNVWEWQDGQWLNVTEAEQMFDDDALDDVNFEEDCTEANYRIAMNSKGKWQAFELSTPFEYVVCARRADEVFNGLPWWGIVLIACLALTICVACIVTIVLTRRRMLKLQEIVEEQLESGDTVLGKPSISQQEQSHRYYNLPNHVDEWEIERRFVAIDYMTKLGEGAFGSVHLGRLLAKNLPIGVGRSIAELAAVNNSNDAVAVKVLHESADSLSEREFRSEIDLMKKIGYHERLVNILACVTRSEPILLITEYCRNGDLLEFLRKRRKYMLENTEDLEDGNFITVKKQIMFAIQIAYGLASDIKSFSSLIILFQEYLSSRGFIHRDVAARNIMVDQQETCKIGDFGLCRSVGSDEENYQSHGGKLPLKWMSPEAIDKYHFSAVSDVWSYGILLFEIVTLGGTPYADWPAAELLMRLKRGERMDRPDNCSENLFEVMSNCWAELPSERPTFTKLRKRLGILLEDVNQDDYYLKLNAQANYYVMESNVS